VLGVLRLAWGADLPAAQPAVGPGGQVAAAAPVVRQPGFIDLGVLPNRPACRARFPPGDWRKRCILPT